MVRCCFYSPLPTNSVDDPIFFLQKMWQGHQRCYAETLSFAPVLNASRLTDSSDVSSAFDDGCHRQMTASFRQMLLRYLMVLIVEVGRLRPHFLVLRYS
jgi:hypothetical protein